MTNAGGIQVMGIPVQQKSQVKLAQEACWGTRQQKNYYSQFLLSAASF